MTSDSKNVPEDGLAAADLSWKKVLVDVASELKGSARSLSRSERLWSMMPSLLTALFGLIAILVVYRLKDSVELALKEREIGVTTAVAMRDIELSALNEKATEQEAIASALALATFGDRSLPFLVQLSAIANPTQKLAARTGLRAVGIAEHARTCSYLLAVLDSRSRLYGWESMLLAAEVSADLACAENTRSISAFLALVQRAPANATEFARVVQNSPPLDQGAARAVLDRLHESIERLQSGTR